MLRSTSYIGDGAEELSMGRRRLRVFIALVVTALTAGTTLTVLLAPTYLQRHRYATTKGGCWDVPRAPTVTPQTHPDSYLWPYGAVYTCRVLDSVAHVFGKVDVSFTLLLDTEKGPVLVRMDYLNTTAGRQYVAEATELTPPAGVDLPDEDVATIERAITRRGGLQPTPWIVHYGDG